MKDSNAEWQKKGGALSDKTAREEFGLTQDEIVRSIQAGQIRYQICSMYGNPYFRLLRREVEALARDLHGEKHVRNKQAKAELSRINRQLRQLKAQIAALEDRKSKLTDEVGG